MFWQKRVPLKARDICSGPEEKFMIPIEELFVQKVTLVDFVPSSSCMILQKSTFCTTLSLTGLSN